MSDQTIRLHAFSLCSKFGFDDGDLLSSHAVLIAVVRKYLLPLLDPRIEVEEINTHHNPIRATTLTRHLVDEDVYVDVPLSDLVALGHEPIDS